MSLTGDFAACLSAAGRCLFSGLWKTKNSWFNHVQSPTAFVLLPLSSVCRQAAHGRSAFSDKPGSPCGLNQQAWQVAGRLLFFPDLRRGWGRYICVEDRCQPQVGLCKHCPPFLFLRQFLRLVWNSFRGLG